MAGMVGRFEGDLGKEWKKHKQDFMNVLDDLKKSVGEEVDVTAEFNVGVVKLTIELKLNRSPSSTTQSGKAGS